MEDVDASGGLKGASGWDYWIGSEARAGSADEAEERGARVDNAVETAVFGADPLIRLVGGLSRTAGALGQDRTRVLQRVDPITPGTDGTEHTGVVIACGHARVLRPSQRTCEVF